MKIQSTNSVSFKNANVVNANYTSNATNSTKTDKTTTKKDKFKNMAGPLALGLVVASSVFMLVRTDPVRIAKIANKGSSKNSKYLSSGFIEIEVKNFKDNKNVKSLDELSGLDKIKEFINEYQIILQHPDVKKEHNIQDFSSLLFWGVPGTGKSTAAKGIAKKLDADFIQIDKELFDSKYVAEGPQKLAEVFDQIETHAKCNPKKTIVIFMDEIDGTISIDIGSAARHSDDLINGLKKGMIHLQEECDNIIFIGATNKDPNGIKSDNTTLKLNPAILSRFKHQIEVALPMKEALCDAWTKLMRTASGIDKFTSKENEVISHYFYELGLSYRDIEVVADKLNRLDAVQFCQTKSYNSKENLIKAMLNDEKIGYDPVKKQTIARKKLEQLITSLEKDLMTL